MHHKWNLTFSGWKEISKILQNLLFSFLLWKKKKKEEKKMANLTYMYCVLLSLMDTVIIPQNGAFEGLSMYPACFCVSAITMIHI